MSVLLEGKYKSCVDADPEDQRSVFSGGRTTFLHSDERFEDNSGHSKGSQQQHQEINTLSDFGCSEPSLLNYSNLLFNFFFKMCQFNPSPVQKCWWSIQWRGTLPDTGGWLTPKTAAYNGRLGLLSHVKGHMYVRGNMTAACENGSALSDTLVLKERKEWGDNLQVIGVNKKVRCITIFSNLCCKNPM